MTVLFRILIAGSLLATIASTLSVYPHQLAYFNEAAGGPENGHRHLLGSNLDWGQSVPVHSSSLGSTGVFLEAPYDVRFINRALVDVAEPAIRDLYADGAFPEDIDELHVSFSACARLFPRGGFTNSVVSHGVQVELLPGKCVLRREID